MKVLGYTDEVTTCDCCGKKNLKGSFCIETDEGAEVYYGSVCVNKVYGKKQGKEISFIAKQIAKAQAGSWEWTLDYYMRGHLQPLQAYIGEKMAWNNSRETQLAVTSLRYKDQLIRERPTA